MARVRFPYMDLTDKASQICILIEIQHFICNFLEPAPLIALPTVGRPIAGNGNLFIVIKDYIYKISDKYTKLYK